MGIGLTRTVISKHQETYLRYYQRIHVEQNKHKGKSLLLPGIDLKIAILNDLTTDHVLNVNMQLLVFCPVFEDENICYRGLQKKTKTINCMGHFW